MKTTVAAFLTIGCVLAFAGATAAAVPVTTGGTLVAQWDASAITGLSDGQAVTSWADSSGNGTNAGTSGYGAHGTPIYHTNVQNGLAAVWCSTYGGADIGDWFTFSSITPTHVFFVAKDDRPYNTSQSTIMGNSGFHQWDGSGTQIFSYAPASTLWTGKLNGASVTLGAAGSRSGLQQAFVLSIDTSASPLATNSMGNDRNGYGYRTWAGDYYEVLLYTGTLTAEEENAIGYYLQDKWGLAGAYTQPMPEPATMSLLVIGGIAAMIRRKRG
ncbi:MAG: PEP-CTERM sorting domain-containing protein [Planctomycetaceae bacterium]|nr:PEP-CTERM sorting domain-containing protein [Planctomycetaceae bacterium]